jgi:hypothetical protein
MTIVTATAESEAGIFAVGSSASARNSVRPIFTWEGA